MMQTFSVFRTATGQVLRSGYISSGSIEDQVLPGESVIAEMVDGSSHRIDNGQAVALGEKPSVHHVFNWAAKQWIDPRTLADLKAAKWQAIKQARDAQEASGFPYQGKQIDSDPRSVQRITTAVQFAGAAQQAGQPFQIEWTCQDNTALTLDGPGMQGMPVALAMHANTLHEKARDLRMQIDVATTPEQLNLIGWSLT